MLCCSNNHLGEIPLIELQSGAQGFQSENSTSDMTVVLASPCCDLQFIFSVARVLEVANLPFSDVV